MRAAAREIYGELVASEANSSIQTPNTPLPDPPSLRYGAASPPPQGGREQKVEGGGKQEVRRGETSLTAQARALYEDSPMPVRDIAALIGVTERTIYKYAAKGGWKRRYQFKPRGAEVASANRGRSRQPAPDFAPGDAQQSAADFAPVKGAGGRFVRRDDKGLAFAQGLKATDPAGAARASAACLEADRLARQAQGRAEFDVKAGLRAEASIKAMNDICRSLGQLHAHRENHFKEQRKRYRVQYWQREHNRAYDQPFQPYRPPRTPLPADDPVEVASDIAIRQALERLDALMAEGKEALRKLAEFDGDGAGNPLRHSGAG